jgi:SAM-dependent methyltransferase
MINNLKHNFSILRLKLRKRLKKEEFYPSFLSLFINPVYITRKGLLKGISIFASKIEGDILDFGCGSKPYESLFERKKSYVGVDIKVSGHNHDDSKVDCYYNGKSLPFPDNSFDCVVCFEVLEHVFNIDDLLPEIRRVLKPKGFFLGSLPFIWEEHEIPYDFARYSSFGIKHIFNRNFFHVVDLKKSTTYVLAIAQLSIIYIINNLIPQSILGRIISPIVIFPLNITALFFNFILPKKYSLYCNIIIFCKNSKS